MIDAILFVVGVYVIIIFIGSTVSYFIEKHKEKQDA